MGRRQFTHTYDDIISLENLIAAWQEFVSGKRSRNDVQEFERNFMSNIIMLHTDLASKTYRHGAYEAFNISDPKPRNIHKASVRDRLVHHAVYRRLYLFFDATFISDAYSCRIGKGTHKAINRFRSFAYKASHNHTQTVWVLKCDIKKFFASIEHAILLAILERHIPDQNILRLLKEIIESFHSTHKGVGLPLGNLTSQLFANVYLNEFDQFMKHNIKARFYIRYADDFVILSHNKEYLKYVLPCIEEFLIHNLQLALHPDKVSITAVASGVDFLGWVHFPDHRVVRMATKRRMLKNITLNEGKEEKVQSYMGLLSHGNSWKLRHKIETYF